MAPRLASEPTNFETRLREPVLHSLSDRFVKFFFVRKVARDDGFLFIAVPIVQNVVRVCKLVIVAVRESEFVEAKQSCFFASNLDALAPVKGAVKLREKVWPFDEYALPRLAE